MGTPPGRVEARSRLLINPPASLPFSAVTVLTGHTGGELEQIIDEGTELEHRDLRFRPREVRDYCRRQHTPYNLFDLLLEGGEQVTDSELAADLTRAQRGVWWTVARHGHVSLDTPAWEHWRTGRDDYAVLHLADNLTRWAQEQHAMRDRGLLHRTLWIPSTPLGEIGRYQITHYQYRLDAGDHVQVVPAKQVSLLEAERTIPDIEVLPDALYVRKVDENGGPAGALRYDDPALVQAFDGFLTDVATRHATGLPRWSQRQRQSRQEMRAR